MVCIINPVKYSIRKKLKDAIQLGEDIQIEDPSIFNPRMFTTADMGRGEKIVVTNHPKRSYFCTIEKDIDGKLKVY